MILDPRQVELTTLRFAEREPQRTRNQRLIREGRLLEADSPERVEMFLARRAFTTADGESLLRDAEHRAGAQGGKGRSDDRVAIRLA